MQSIWHPDGGSFFLWQTCSKGKACTPQALLVLALLELTQRYQPLTRSLTSFCPPVNNLHNHQKLFQGWFSSGRGLEKYHLPCLPLYLTLPGTMPHQKPITKPLNLKLSQPIPEDIITSNFHSAPYFPHKIKLFQGWFCSGGGLA